MPNTKDTTTQNHFWQKPLALLSSAFSALKGALLAVYHHIIGTIILGATIIRQMIAHWYRPTNRTSDFTLTIFHTAAKWRLTLFFPMLNKRRDSLQTTFLHYIARYGTPETARTLIKSGAAVNATNNIDNTPLHLAAVYNTPETVKVLIEAGANVHAKNNFYAQEHTPLDWSLDNFKQSAAFQTPAMLEKIHLLIQAGAAFTIDDTKAMLSSALRLHPGREVTHLRFGISYLPAQKAQATAKHIIKVIRSIFGTAQETLAEFTNLFPELTELLQNAVYQNRKVPMRENQMMGAHLAEKLIAAQQSVSDTPNHLVGFPEEIVKHICEYISPIKAHQNALVMGFQQRLAHNNPTTPSAPTSKNAPETSQDPSMLSGNHIDDRENITPCF